MSGEDEFARDRRVEQMRGARRHWDPARPRVESQSRALRQTEKQRAVLDVLCRGRLIVRVLAGGAPGEYEVALEVVGQKGGGTAFVDAPGLSGPGRAFNLFPLGEVPFIVGCRCGKKMHDIDSVKLRTLAWQGQRGRPRSCGVADVERVDSR